MGEHRQPRDPVVIYNVMRDAARHVMAVYASQVTIGGIEDPSIQKLRAIMLEAEAVDPHDEDAQIKATESFRALYRELRVDPQTK